MPWEERIENKVIFVLVRILFGHGTLELGPENIKKPRAPEDIVSYARAELIKVHSCIDVHGFQSGIEDMPWIEINTHVKPYLEEQDIRDRFTNGPAVQRSVQFVIHELAINVIIWDLDVTTAGQLVENA